MSSLFPLLRSRSFSSNICCDVAVASFVPLDNFKGDNDFQKVCETNKSNEEANGSLRTIKDGVMSSKRTMGENVVA